MSDSPNPKCTYEILQPASEGDDSVPCGAPAVYWGDADHERAFCDEHAQILHGEFKDEHLDKIEEESNEIRILLLARRVIDVQAETINEFYKMTPLYTFDSIEQAGAYNVLVQLRAKMTPEGVKAVEGWQGPEATKIIYPSRMEGANPTEAQLNEAARVIAINIQSIIHRSGLSLDQVVNLLERIILDIKREKVIDQPHGS